MLVGLDLGGTHIDGAVIDDGAVLKTIKREVDPDDLFSTIWTTLSDLLMPFDTKDIDRITLSTTISTNAIVEQKIDPVGLIVACGPGITHDFSAISPTVFHISGSIDHRGIITDPIDQEQIESVSKKIVNEGLDHCAVVTKFSTRNVEMETRMADYLEGKVSHVTMGHRMSGRLNFPRRVNTTYLNEAVYSVFNNFADKSSAAMSKMRLDVPLNILKADGGMMDLPTAQEHPVETILSGPAASLSGILSLSKIREDAILLDIGGTTTDIFFLADGVPLFAPDGAVISDYRTLVRAVYSVSIGLGGDSRVKLVDDKIHIGPEREGKPYAYGGPAVTATDAMIVLGLIENTDEDQRERAVRALTEIKGAFAVEQTALSILTQMARTIKETTDRLLRNINERPVYTIKELLHEKKLDPRSIHIIGGPAKALAPYLEEVYSLECHVPPFFDIGNAVGAALSNVTKELTLTANCAVGILSVPEIGLTEGITEEFSLAQAKARLFELFNEIYHIKEQDCEIVEESCYTMVRGFSSAGKNIRLKAQVKPRMIHVMKEI
ncbi:MAG: hydantoinase/oxoprolinase family protein [Sphaerochaetaceae bacterium]